MEISLIGGGMMKDEEKITPKKGDLITNDLKKIVTAYDMDLTDKQKAAVEKIQNIHTDKVTEASRALAEKEDKIIMDALREEVLFKKFLRDNYEIRIDEITREKCLIRVVDETIIANWKTTIEINGEIYTVL